MNNPKWSLGSTYHPKFEVGIVNEINGTKGVVINEHPVSIVTRGDIVYKFKKSHPIGTPVYYNEIGKLKVKKQKGKKPIGCIMSLPDEDGYCRITLRFNDGY